jgi:hypothetical protein
VTNFRWHILDSLPFNNNIRFFMELFSHERTPGLSYARIGYHYAFPGITDDHMAIMPDDLRHLKLPKNWYPAARMGARNSVFFDSEKTIQNPQRTKIRSGSLWAGGKLLVWTPREAGESKTFSFNVTKEGKKRIHFAAALNPASGKISALFDGDPLLFRNKAKSIDLFKPYRVLLRNFTFQDQELKPGKHTLTFKYEGATSKTEKPEIGLDFIWIQDIAN